MDKGKRRSVKIWPLNTDRHKSSICDAGRSVARFVRFGPRNSVVGGYFLRALRMICG